MGEASVSDREHLVGREAGAREPGLVILIRCPCMTTNTTNTNTMTLGNFLGEPHGEGPASFMVVDPDGNPVLFDQHV
jgi:hypothetical protein